MSAEQQELINRQFAQIVEAESLRLDTVVPVATDDRDLNAFFELRLLGDTDVVDNNRAEYLEERCQAEVYSEVAARYGLTYDEMMVACEAAHKRAYIRRQTEGHTYGY
jgi:protein-disulfide isomerase-like protein with CxxC motif